MHETGRPRVEGKKKANFSIDENLLSRLKAKAEKEGRTVARYRSILGAQKTDRKPPSTIDFSIAAELGCSRHTVSLARMKNGKARQRDIDFSDADWTKTNPKLAQEYNCSVRTVWNARRRLGIEQKPRGRQTTK